MNLTQNGSASSFLKRLEQSSGRPALIATRLKQMIIPFRCATNGRPFNAVLTQQSPNHRFQIERMERGGGGAVASSGADGEEAATFSRDIPMSQIDFAGWFCPHCSFGKSSNVEPFARCGKCQELICGGRIRRLDAGSKIFSCHDGCGGGGLLAGEITSYQARTSDPAGLLGYARPAAIGVANHKLLPR